MITRSSQAIFTALLFFSAIENAFGQIASPDSLANAWSAELGIWSVFKFLLILTFVLGLVWFSLSMLKKVTGHSGGALKGVEIIGGLPLGPRKSLIFVKIVNKVHIVGVTDHNLNSIGVIEDPAEIEAIGSLDDRSGARPFKEIFSKLTAVTPTRNPSRGIGED